VPGIKVITVIQARMGSSRLPGKVFLPLAGKELLVRMAERVCRASLCGCLVIATTDRPADDAVARLCEREGYLCFRGHETDLLDRHYRAAKKYRAGAVVKIPSDCPLIDPAIIDRVILAYLQGYHSAAPYDYVSNLHPPSYPDGNDVEIMSFKTLEEAWLEADQDFEREHTTPFIWERPQRFHLGNVSFKPGIDYSMSHRLTIDYPEDYQAIKAIYDRLYDKNPNFGLEEILHLLQTEMEIFQINKKYAGVNWYRHYLDRLHTVNKGHTRLECDQAEKNME